MKTENHKNSKQNHQNDSMLKQKTNEDFNKKQPDPKDPNESKAKINSKQ